MGEVTWPEISAHLEKLCVDWSIEFRPSWLCIKDRGPLKPIVVSVRPDALLGHNLHRIYDGWANGRKVYDAASEFKAGQVIKVS